MKAGQRIVMQKKETPEIPPKDIARIVGKYRSRLGKKVLLELANTGGTDFARFRRWFPIFSLDHDDNLLRKYRDELRIVWGLPLDSNRILDDWTRRDPVDPKKWATPLWIVGRGYVEPNPAHLGLLLTTAIRDNADSLGYCPNPECPNRFFIKPRKNQKVCDRPACASFVRKESKRTWWERCGPDWRAQRRAKKTATVKKSNLSRGDK
jgi:hypothetical protein